MRIELTRSGGFANLTLRRSLDTNDLSSEEARALTRLVDRADLAGLSKKSPIRGSGADRFQYDLTITHGDEKQHVSVAEGKITSELRALIDKVLEKPSQARDSR